MDSFIRKGIIAETIFRVTSDSAAAALWYCPRTIRRLIRSLELREFLLEVQDGWSLNMEVSLTPIRPKLCPTDMGYRRQEGLGYGSFGNQTPPFLPALLPA